MTEYSRHAHPSAVPQSSITSRVDVAERCLYRRQLRNWKLGAICSLAALLLFITAITAGGITADGTVSGDYIARIKADGMIIADDERNQRLKKIAEDTHVKAVILHINSPGGTLTGGEDWYRELRAISAKKPVVAVVDGMAASGGYMAALGTDRIFVREGSIVGSIGVIYQSANIQGLAEKMGVRVLSYASGSLKAQPSPFSDIAPGAKKMIMTMINDIQDMFLGMAKERRNLSDDVIALISDGRIVSGRRSVELNLADAIGSEDAALAWLKDKQDIAGDILVKDRNLAPEKTFFEHKFGTLLPGWLGSAADQVAMPAGMLALHPF